MKILFVADVIGKPGLEALRRIAPGLIEETGARFVIANGENGLDGRGFDADLAKRYRDAGVHVITGGNHTFDSKPFRKVIASLPFVLRPLNLPPAVEGRGWSLFEVDDGVKVAVISLMGRTYMAPIDCPFRSLEAILPQIRRETPLIVVDFHAEATAEKQALARCFDGSVTAVIGTHTHVQTADESILPNGTGFICDAGMSGPFESIIGNAIRPAIDKFLLQIPVSQYTAPGAARLQGVLLEADSSSGRCLNIQRISRD